MINQLQPTQISVFWPAIKETILRSCPLIGDKLSKYTNHLLEGLLSGSYQCWLMHERPSEDEHELYGVLITSIVNNKIFGYSVFVVDHMYAFRKWNNELVSETFECFKKFAKNASCVSIEVETNNEKAQQMAKRFGFEHETTRMRYQL